MLRAHNGPACANAKFRTWGAWPVPLWLPPRNSYPNPLNCMFYRLRVARNILRSKNRAMTAHPAKHGAPLSQLQVAFDQYPQNIRRDESVVEDMYGIKVADPYRWLEDPDSSETQAFVAAQNALWESVRSKCDTRDRFRDLFTSIYNFEKWSTPGRLGSGRFVFSHNTGLQNQYVLYIQDSLEGPRRVLLDPNGLSDDGTIALGRTAWTGEGCT